MAQLSFGEILARAREHKGMDVSTVARKLRIRPDILRAIEAGDFSRMPPHGYTRNMINAYARLVGLNPSEITRMYLDTAYAVQVEKARAGSLARRGATSRPSRTSDIARQDRTRRGLSEEIATRSYAERGSSARQRSQMRTGAQSERSPRQNALGRTLYDDRRSYTRGDYDAPSSTRLRQSDRTRPSRHSALPHSQYTNFYAGPQGTGTMQSRLPFVIAGVIILVLLIIILVLIFGPKSSQNTDDLTTVPITGLTDTTQSDEDTTEETQEEVTAPTSVSVEYSVSGDSEIYVEISSDGGEAQGAMLSSGTTETVEVSGTWTISTWIPDSLTVTVDGDEVEFTQDGSSMPYCTVDFSSYLTAWYEEYVTSSDDTSS